ncbi:hypothetical protein TNCV_4786621 [Trichonephila clavipes]|nr:hypothetical protein TNCV_4786621 [Trichonephila clavipes]
MKKRCIGLKYTTGKFLRLFIISSDNLFLFDSNSVTVVAQFSRPLNHGRLVAGSSLVPLKIRRVEEAAVRLIWHPPVGVVWKLGKGDASSGIILVTRLRFKITRSVLNSPRATL